MQVKNLLFDLGGVLYEIDIAGTLDRYEAMRAPELGPIDYGKQSQHARFSDLDEGKIDIDTFAQRLKDEFQLQGSQAAIKRIWAELLIGVLPGRVEAIQHLAKHYRLALLSNTSRYHYSLYEEACRPMFSRMDHLFFSFEMGLRKPDPRIYEQALQQAGWAAEETLFFDDSKVNIEAAEALGIQTYWVKEHEDFDHWYADQKKD